MRIVGILVMAALLGACTAPEYPVPPQKIMPSGPEPRLSKSMLQMGDEDADTYILNDVGPADPGSEWRWTGPNPRFKLWLEAIENWEFYIQFRVVPVVLEQTGPVTLTILIGDTILATPRFTEAKEYEYTHRVPPGLLAVDQPVVIGIDIDPVYIAKRDKQKLGILLRSIGLRKIDPK